MNEASKLKYIELIQSNIDRMFRASFSYKALSITFVTVILGAAIRSEEPQLVFLALLPISFFGSLDSYHLSIERRFRKLYEKAIAADVVSFELNPNSVIDDGSLSVWAALRSQTIVVLYAPLLFVCMVTGVLLLC